MIQDSSRVEKVAKVAVLFLLLVVLWFLLSGQITTVYPPGFIPAKSDCSTTTGLGLGCLDTDAVPNPTFSIGTGSSTVTIGPGASSTPGGADTQVQFNDAGTFGGDAQFTWNKTTNTLTVDGTITIVCDPATQVCINQAQNETVSPTDPTTTTLVNWGFVNDELEWFDGGGALKRALRTGTTRSVYIPAGLMSVSGTCTDVAPVERTIVASGPKRYTIQPADGDTCSIEFDMVMPDAWDGGTLTVELHAFSSANNTTEILELDFAGQCVRSGDAVAAHSTTGEQAASVTFGAQANDERHGTTAAITLNGTCAAGAHVYMRGQVDATATTVTPVTDIHVLGVKVEYTINAVTD